MSLARVSLVLIQAIANQWACTPPNPTRPKSRYYTEELYILQIAPLVFKIHMAILWICAIFEVLCYTTSFFSLSSISPLAPRLICPTTSDPKIYATPIFTIGIILVVLGSYIRLDCFKTLGPLFTFDLTVLPEHKLVTKRFYAYVRHPSYTGSILIIVGLAFSHLTEGSWLTECGPLSSSGSAIVVWVMWWAWTLAVGVSRAGAEDKQMRKMFNEEWDKYAAAVPWWFFPGF